MSSAHSHERLTHSASPLLALPNPPLTIRAYSSPFSKISNRPDYNLADFRVKSVVDWMDLTMVTKRPTNHQMIQRVLRRHLALHDDAAEIFVDVMDAGPGGAGTQFRMRFQDMSSAQELRGIREVLKSTFDLALIPALNGIEVAADFLHNERRPDQTRNMVFALASGLLANGGWCRQFDPISGDTLKMQHPSARINPELMTYFANRTDELSWKVYWKRTDKGGVPIPPDQHRARVEVTLKQASILRYFGGENGPQSLDFENLGSLFRFRIPRFEREDVPSNVFSAGSRWLRKEGLATPLRGAASYEMRQALSGGRNRYSPLTVSDVQLNKRVRQSLWHFTRTFDKNKRVKMVTLKPFSNPLPS